MDQQSWPYWTSTAVVADSHGYHLHVSALELSHEFALVAGRNIALGKIELGAAMMAVAIVYCVLLGFGILGAHGGVQEVVPEEWQLCRRAEEPIVICWQPGRRLDGNSAGQSGGALKLIAAVCLASLPAPSFLSLGA